MKKFVSIFLTLAMILAMSTVAFAAETTLTIDGEEGRTYNGYKLLDLTVSLKANCDCAEGATHKDTCYNYAYTVNETYEEILQELAGEGNDIIEYLTGLTSDSDSGYGTLRDVADDIFKAIKENSKITPDAENLDGNNNTIDQGYWLFADVTSLDNQNEANSLVMVDTAGQDPVTINPKTALPTVEKKVKDITDSEDANIDDNAWQDSADHDIDDTVPFKLTATLPSNFAYYDTYQIVFHDTLSAGLTLDTDSIKVYMYNTKAEADADTELDDGTDVTASFTTTATGLDDDCTFEVSCANVTAIENVNKDTVFVVYYEATLNENAEIGAEGNPNEVYLEFSNNPYDEGTGETEKDEVIVFTYKLIINKTDAEGKALKGAGFTLYKKNSNSEYVPIGGELVGNDMTTFEWEGLDDGDYKLVETTVPAGYNKMTDIEFTITATHTNDPEELKLTSLGGGEMGTGAVETGAIEKDIVNNTGTILPETGAEGTLMLITISTMLVIVACVFMVTRKKMSIYED